MYGHYAQALEKVGKLKHIRLSDELTNQSEDNPEEDPQIVDLFIKANAMNKKAYVNVNIIITCCYALNYNVLTSDKRVPPS